jgi:hypothetical protein
VTTTHSAQVRDATGQCASARCHRAGLKRYSALPPSTVPARAAPSGTSRANLHDPGHPRASRRCARARARLEPWEGKKEAISFPIFLLGSRAFPTLHLRPRNASRDVLSDRPRRKGSSGASLDDVPLASGQARQQLTSSAACEEPDSRVSCRMSHSSARCQCKNAFAQRQLGARPACFPACARASQSSGGPGILALPFIHSR